MTFTDKELEALRLEIEKRISPKRFSHTLGVERAALRIGEYCLDSDLCELSAAALLHDVTKEYKTEEHIALMKKAGSFSDEDFMSSPVYHSFTAPIIIERDFKLFSTAAIRSAVFNHTLGAPDMTVFDEIIFISDYVEDGRSYPSSIEIRNKLYESLGLAKDREECIVRLHEATVSALDATLAHLIKSGAFIHPQAVRTRNAFLGRMPMAL